MSLKCDSLLVVDGWLCSISALFASVYNVLGAKNCRWMALSLYKVVGGERELEGVYRGAVRCASEDIIFCSGKKAFLRRREVARVKVGDDNKIAFFTLRIKQVCMTQYTQ